MAAQASWGTAPCIISCIMSGAPTSPQLSRWRSLSWLCILRPSRSERPADPADPEPSSPIIAPTKSSASKRAADRAAMPVQ